MWDSGGSAFIEDGQRWVGFHRGRRTCLKRTSASISGASRTYWSASATMPPTRMPAPRCERKLPALAKLPSISEGSSTMPELTPHLADVQNEAGRFKRGTEKAANQRFDVYPKRFG